MSDELFKGKWNQFKGKVKEKWGKLTDDELTEIDGKRDQLLGKLQTKYSWEKSRAQKELESFEKTLANDDDRIPKKRTGEKFDKFNKDEDEDDFPKRKAL